MITEEQLQQALAIISEYRIQLHNKISAIDKEVDFLKLTIIDTSASVRLINAINHNISELWPNKEIKGAKVPIHYFAGMDLSDFLSKRLFGTRSLVELDLILKSYGIELTNKNNLYKRTRQH